MDGRQPAAVTLSVLMRPFAVGWREQIEHLLQILVPDTSTHGSTNYWALSLYECHQVLLRAGPS
jgi:hypothetical protein